MLWRIQPDLKSALFSGDECAPELVEQGPVLVESVVQQVWVEVFLQKIVSMWHEVHVDQSARLLQDIQRLHWLVRKNQWRHGPAGYSAYEVEVVAASSSHFVVVVVLDTILSWLLSWAVHETHLWVVPMWNHVEVWHPLPLCQRVIYECRYSRS